METRSLLFAASVTLLAADASAVPVVAGLRATPSFVLLGQLTPVKVTATILDPSLIESSVTLQRLNVDPNLPAATTIGTMRDDGTRGDEIAGDHVFTLVTNLQAPATGSIRLRVSAIGRPNNRVFSDVLSVTAGQQVSAGVSAVVVGTGHTSMIVPPADYDVVAAIEAVAPSVLKAPTGALRLAAVVKVVYQPLNVSGSFPPPSTPLRISVPAPTASSVTNYVVAQEVVTDDITSATPGLTEQLMLVDSATTTGGQIVTDSTVLPGVFGGGTLAFLANTGSGYVKGTVTGSAGLAAGAVVSNSTNRIVSVTSGTGEYTLYVNGGPFSVTAFDPFRGAGGIAAGTIVDSGSMVTANITMVPLLAPPITRDGIRNAGFERGDLTSWSTTGMVNAVQQFGPTSTGVVIRPREGAWMADVSTGPGAVGGVGSAITQSFIAPAGVRTLRFDFDFISEEFPEFVGTVYNDTFTAVISTPNGDTTFAGVSVNQAAGFELIGDCFFPGGDETCGHTGWLEGSVDLSEFSGTDTPITIGLLFSSNDAGDNIYDTHVLIDNLRFSTVWIDQKLMTGSGATPSMALEQIEAANEILSQAGINVRLRDSQTIADPGGLLDLDVAWNDSPVTDPTAEELALMAIGRSRAASDLNVYYVRSLTGYSAVALAIGPDDFRNVSLATNAGIVMSAAVFPDYPDSLAHEAGHILISPEMQGDSLEHNIGVATNIMYIPRTVPRNVLTRAQSANINRIGAPLLQP